MYVIMMIFYSLFSNSASQGSAWHAGGVYAWTPAISKQVDIISPLVLYLALLIEGETSEGSERGKLLL